MEMWRFKRPFLMALKFLRQIGVTRGLLDEQFGKFAHSNQPSSANHNCHPERSNAKWRDLQLPLVRTCQPSVVIMV
jgi:hypothetical protein